MPADYLANLIPLKVLRFSISAPAAASALTATANAGTTITLDWLDNSAGEATFQVDRSPTGIGSWTPIHETARGVVTYDDTGLLPGTYFYRVVAKNPYESASASNVAGATSPTGGTPPLAPSSLNAAAISSTRVDLTWVDNANNETAFRIQRGEGASGPWLDLVVLAANVTSYSDTTAEPETFYRYQIRTENAAGNSAYSNIASATTPEESTPEIQVLPTFVAAAQAKATANTSQYLAFKARLDSRLTTVILGGYFGHGLIEGAHFALGYLCEKDRNPSLADDYAHKAMGLLQAWIREQQGADEDYQGIHFLARGDGMQTVFTLPFTPLTTPVIWSAPVATYAVTRSAGSDYDLMPQDFGLNGNDRYYWRIIKVSDTNDGPEDYVRGADWSHGENSSDQVIHWESGGSKPSNGATYYMTVDYSLSTSSPNSAAVVSSGDYEIVGTTLTFDTAPASDRSIYAKYVYHAPGGLNYQQTYNDFAGFTTLFGATGYPNRNLAFLAMMLDWLYGHPDFPAPLRADVIQYLIDTTTIVTAGGATYGPITQVMFNPNVIDSNYGDGHWLYRAVTACALDGRDAYATTLLSALTTWRTTYVLPKLLAPSAAVSTLADGHWQEGATYGAYGSLDFIMGALALNDSALVTTTEEFAWTTEAILSWLHQQPSLAYVYSAGEGPGNPQPVGGVENDTKAPKSYHMGVLAAATPNAAAKSYANWWIQNISETFSTHFWDLFFRDPLGTPANPTGAGLPTARFHRGTGLLVSRAAWNYTSTWMAFVAAKSSEAGHYIGRWGDLHIYRGGDPLLSDGPAQGGYVGNQNNHLYGNVIVTDNGGLAGMQVRFAPGVWHGSPGVVTDGLVASGYAWATTNYKAAYSYASSPGDDGHLVELEAEVMHVLPEDYIVRYDRIQTDLAAQAKHLRFHLQSTAVTPTGGTFTLTHSGNTTSALAYNASAATVQAALEALASIGSGNVSVSWAGEVGSAPGQFNGHFDIRFVGALAGTTQPFLTVDATNLTTLGGSAPTARVQDMHTSGAAGARTRQIVFLGETITGGAFGVTSGASKLFGKTYSTESLTCNYETTQISNGAPTNRLRRAVIRNTNDAASVRYVTGFQTAPSATVSMDASEHLVGTNSMLEGLRLGNTICMFRRPRTGFILPDTYDFTGTGATITHRISGLTPGQAYAYSGSASGTVLANSKGIVTFTSAGSGARTITLAVTTPPSPAYAYTFRDPGISDDLAALYIAEGSTPNWWVWQAAVAQWDGSNKPGVMLSQHNDGESGTRFFRNLTTGDNYNFVDVTTSELGVDGNDLGNTPGQWIALDVDNSGTPDFSGKGASGDGPIHRLIGSTLTRLGALPVTTDRTFFGHGNYVFGFDSDASGFPRIRDQNWAAGTHATAWSDITVRTRTWNGSGYTSVPTAFDLPAGVPTGLSNQILADFQACAPAEGNLFLCHMDLNDDGIDDLVIMADISYNTPLSFAYYLENDGAGNYTDRTSAWGLPRLGVFLPLQNMQYGFWRCESGWDGRYHKTFGDGNLNIFIANGTAPGQYRWNGSGYTRLSNPVTTALTNIDNINFHDVYLVQAFVLDLTNRGTNDLIIHYPRGTFFLLFKNDGTGTFTKQTGFSLEGAFRSGDPYGLCVADFRDVGRLDIAMYNCDFSNPGGVGFNKVAVMRNDTSNPGNWIKVRLNRATGNKKGVGGLVQIMDAGTSTEFARCKVPPSGVDIHFGVGSRTTCKVVVTWPTGSPTTLDDQAVNQLITVTS
ncbi:MAG: ASPIC/UnbV domain-containing protein [Phycisphaerales bacterium]